MKFGMVTDLHFADEDPKNNRYYRESAHKLENVVQLMNREEVAFLIELGDLKDQNEPPVESGTLRYLEEIERVFQKFSGPGYHVLGNHDMDSISKTQFLNRIRNTGIPGGKSYYSFDSQGVHFVVLDANFTGDGRSYDSGNFDWTDANIPAFQLKWLEADLAETALPVIVFVHQLLDGEGDHYVNNAADVRNILKKKKNVLAVFQGHLHPGRYSFMDGIHFYTLAALVEGQGMDNNACAVVEIMNDFSLHIEGFWNAKSLQL